MKWFTVSRLSDHIETTPEGFVLCCDVPIARTGIQYYRDDELPMVKASGDGWISVERDESEVFRPDSIASFQGKPICDDHPTDMVGPDNWHKLAIGHMQNVRRGDGINADVLVADLLFTAARGIELVKAGKRALSVGYEANYVQDVPGRASQRDIYANHVALVDEGRCGARCVILDGAPQYNYDAEWNESDHPRDDDGKFGHGGGGGGSAGIGTQSWSKSSPPNYGEELNGVAFTSYVAPSSNKAWEAQAKNTKADFHEPPLPKTSKAQGAGVIIKEPDGRIWIVHPTNEYGGYKATFPKGTVEPDMTTHGTALKEAYEESGLRVKLTGFAGDVERTTSTARYYYAERIGGTPGDHHWETDKVTLAEPDELKSILNHKIDHKMVDDFIAKAEASAPKPTPAPAQPATAAAGPIPISNWKKTGGKLGSNEGGQYTDENGKLHYVKIQKSDDHAKNEHLAARLYEAAGAPVLDTKMVDLGNGKLGTATEWKDKENIDLDDPFHRKAAQEHFAAHAWLANWDAIGLGQHKSDWNQAMIDGQMTTVDPGGSMIYRAQGDKKGNAFGDSVGEWDTLRDPKNTQAHKAFKDITPEQMRKSVLNIAKVPDAKIHQLVMQHGPGSKAEQIELAGRMIARKRDLVKRVMSQHGLTTDSWWHDDIDWPADLAA